MINLKPTVKFNLNLTQVYDALLDPVVAIVGMSLYHYLFLIWFSNKSYGKERSEVKRQRMKAKGTTKSTKIYEMSVLIFQVISIKNLLQRSKT